MSVNCFPLLAHEAGGVIIKTNIAFSYSIITALIGSWDYYLIILVDLIEIAYLYL